MASIMPPFSPITREKNVIPFLALLPSGHKGGCMEDRQSFKLRIFDLECKVTKKVE